MRMLSPDTRPEAEKILIEGVRRMTPAEKFRKMEGLNRFLAQMARAAVRRRYPDADEREIGLRVASRRIPPELMRKAFGWDVSKKGY